MPEHPEKQKFAPHLGETFQLHVDEDSSFEVTLAEVSDATQRMLDDAAAAGAPPPFAMVFRGPAEPILRQQIYRLSHEKIGETSLFLVPIGPVGDGIGYEAVFS